MVTFLRTIEAHTGQLENGDAATSFAQVQQQSVSVRMKGGEDQPAAKAGRLKRLQLWLRDYIDDKLTIPYETVLMLVRLVVALSGGPGLTLLCHSSCCCTSQPLACTTLTQDPWLRLR